MIIRILKKQEHIKNKKAEILKLKKQNKNIVKQ